MLGHPTWVSGHKSEKNKIKFSRPIRFQKSQRKKYLPLYNSLQSDWLTGSNRSPFKDGKMNLSISPSQLCSHTPSTLNAGTKRRAIWPCLNVATWRRERSDRAIQQM